MIEIGIGLSCKEGTDAPSTRQQRQVYFREKIVPVLRALAVVGHCVLRDTALYSIYSRVLHTAAVRVYCQVLAVFRPYCDYSEYQNTPNLRSNSEYELHFDRLCTVSIMPSPFYCGKHSQMVPGVGVEANYFAGGQLGYLGVLAVVRECVLRVLAVFTYGFDLFDTLSAGNSSDNSYC